MAEKTEAELKAEAKVKAKAEAKAEKEWQLPPDPKIRVRIVNLDLVDSEGKNVAWSFTFRRAAVQRPDGSMVRFEMLSYPLMNSQEYELPTSVIEHLESIKYPVREYTSGEDEGRSMIKVSSRRRFTVSRL